METDSEPGNGPIEVEQDHLRELLKGAIRAYKLKPFVVALVQMVDGEMLYVQYNTVMEKETMALPVGASVDGEVWDPKHASDAQ